MNSIIEDDVDIKNNSNISEYSFNYCDNSVNMYLNEIGKFPLLSVSEERKLCSEIKNGNESAKEKLINSNLRLVVSVAKSYFCNVIPLLDLIQAGNIGLMTAASKFDFSMGYKFSTYAVWWIRQSITRFIANNNSIRLPVNMYYSVIKYKNFLREYENNNNCMPTDEVVCKELGIDSVKLDFIKQAFMVDEVFSLDTPLNIDDSFSFGDTIIDKDAVMPEDAFIENEKKSLLNEILSVLNEREARIIVLRLGLHDDVTRTLEEIASEYGLTRERIRQIEVKALSKLRNACKGVKFATYCDEWCGAKVRK